MLYIIAYFHNDNLNICYYSQIVLLKDKKKVFTLDNLGYEAEVGVIHPSGSTAAVGGAVSGHLQTHEFDQIYFASKNVSLYVTMIYLEKNIAGYAQHTSSHSDNIKCEIHYLFLLRMGRSTCTRYRAIH